MPSRQVRNVLDWIRKFHQGLADQLQSFAESAEDGRVRVLFEDMRRREAKIEHSVHDYQRNAPGAVLDTWLQFGSEDELPKQLHADHLDSSATPADIVARVLEIDDVLVELYRELEGSTSVPELDELFASLIALEEGKQHHYAWVLSELTME